MTSMWASGPVLDQHCADQLSIGSSALCWVPRHACSVVLYSFHHLEPRSPWITRWLDTNQMNDAEYDLLIEFYTSCNAADVWSGRSFNITLSDELIEQVESGETQYQGQKWLSEEVQKLEQVPGDWLQIGAWPVNHLDAHHRGPLFKQMRTSGANSSELFYYRVKLGWVMSDSFELTMNDKGEEVPLHGYFAHCKAYYGPNEGYAVLEYPEFIHWPYWAGKDNRLITVSDTGEGRSEEVAQFEREQEELGSAPTTPTHAMVPGLVGNFAQRYHRHLVDEIVDADPALKETQELLAMFCYFTKHQYWSKCSTLQVQIEKQRVGPITLCTDLFLQLPFAASITATG